jgi:hypothetical protein
MNRFFWSLMAVCLLLVPASASAKLVMPLDNFTLDSQNGVVFSQGGFQVNRAVNFTPGIANATMKFNAAEGSFSMNGGSLTISYSIADNTKTFADLYDSLTPVGYFLDGFTIGARHIVPPFVDTMLGYEVLFNGGDAQMIPMGSGNVSLTSNFEWLTAGNFNTVSFTFQRLSFNQNDPFAISSNFLEIGGPGSPGMAAVPEPSALLLVGTLVGLAGVRRRLRS